MNTSQLNLELLYSNLQPKFETIYKIPFGEDVKNMVKLFYDACKTEEFGIDVYSPDTAEYLLRSVEKLAAIHKSLPTFKSIFLEAIRSPILPTDLTTGLAKLKIQPRPPSPPDAPLNFYDFGLSFPFLDRKNIMELQSEHIYSICKPIWAGNILDVDMYIKNCVVPGFAGVSGVGKTRASKELVRHICAVSP